MNRLRLWVGLVLLLLVLGCAKKVMRGPEDQVPTGQVKVLQHEVVAGETLRRIADNYYGDPERAIDIAAANEMSDPNRVVVGSVLQLKFADREWEAAQRRASALVPYNRGVDHFEQERLAEAERQFRLAIDTAPDLVAARYNLALVLLKRGRNDEALELLDTLCTQRPEDKDFLFARGNALFLLTRFDEAAEPFAQAVALDPNHKRSVFGLARSLQEGGHAAEAVKAWTRYLELDDTSSWADVARRNLSKLNSDAN